MVYISPGKHSIPSKIKKNNFITRCRFMAHSIHEGRYRFQNNPMQKYPKLKELPGRGLLNIKNQ